ncbi:MAG: putative bifunctional diguanylate cyclase/phosphodiesterase [Vicinamibacterales bacterium]
MTRLRLLLIEDSEDDTALLVRELARAGYDVTSERVDTPEGLTAALERQRWDIAIADYTMPRFSGTAALTLLRQHDAEMPFIFVSGTIGEDVAVGAMRTGAHDYIMKGSLKRLVPAVERELREAASRLSRKQAEARLVHLAYHDPLTDLPNRVLLHDRLEQAILAAEQAGAPLGLLILDLDGFKAINDSLGHQVGDRVLQELAARLRALLRDGDTVARLGGDEFAFVLPRTDSDGAALAAREILRALGRPFVLDGRPLELRGSIGITWFPEHGSDADVLLQKADIAMYVAKGGSLGYACYAPDRDRHAHRRLTLMTELRDGIASGQFSFDYQPIVSLQSGAVWSVEALARWDHPRQGRLPPGEFIELAEQTGLIEPLTLVLLDKALAEWSATDAGPSIPVAVNLSPRSLRDPGFPDQVADVLRRRQASPSAIVFEITENFVLSDTTRSMTCLSRLHEMGVKLAIDDFGIGYSSLSYLRRLPVDRLKIDRSFVSGLMSGDDAIVRSTIDLAHNLGLTVVAEGVESAEARDRLLELGCDAAQGNFIAKPGPAADIRRWVARQDPTGRP